MPISEALKRLGAQVGLDMVGVTAGDFEPGPRDLAVVVAGHGREELPALRTGLEAGLPYVGLVASRRRGQGVIGELRSDGVPDELLARIDTPAGLDIGARTPEEIAVSILARIIEVRRGSRAAATAVDPICGMTVTVTGRHALARARGRDGLLLRRGLPAGLRGAARPCLSGLTSAGWCSGRAGRSGSGAPSSCCPTATARCSATSSAWRAGARSTRRSWPSAARRRTCRADVDLGGVEVVVNDAYGEGCSSSIAAALARGGRPRSRCWC